MSNKRCFCLSAPRLYQVILIAFLAALAGQYLSAAAASNNSTALNPRGHNVCARTAYVRRPVRMRQRYRLPVTVVDLARCRQEGEVLCNRKRQTFKTAHRIVVKLVIQTVPVVSCCQGWKKKQENDTECLDPQCTQPCLNGATCIGPEMCLCAKGYAGWHCEKDIDECAGRNSCQQKCSNTFGSYVCSCVEGFKLGADNTSCELCLPCAPEFRALETRLTLLPGEKEVAEEARRYIQADMAEERKRQEDTLDKLQHQHDSIATLQKEVDILPTISSRLDNLTAVYEQVEDIKVLEAQVSSLEDRIDEGLAVMKASHSDLKHSMEVAVETWQDSSMTASSSHSLAMNGLYQKLDKMTARVEALEKDKVSLRDELDSVVSKYESAVSAMSQHSAAPMTTHKPTTEGNHEDPYTSGLDVELRLDSLSKQISILEETMSKCRCDQDYY